MQNGRFVKQENERIMNEGLWKGMYPLPDFIHLFVKLSTGFYLKHS